jgi:hypothetical protein
MRETQSPSIANFIRIDTIDEYMDEKSRRSNFALMMIVIQMKQMICRYVQYSYDREKYDERRMSISETISRSSDADKLRINL